jgi:hypothetical protein
MRIDVADVRLPAHIYERTARVQQCAGRLRLSRFLSDVAPRLRAHDYYTPAQIFEMDLAACRLRV